MKRLFWLFALGAAALLAPGPALALGIGESAPGFSLIGTDDQTHSLESYADKPVLVVIFSCNHCPYVQAYEGRMMQIQERNASRGVQIVAINANDATTHPGDSFEAMKARAAEKGFNFPYLRDESQAAARAYAATRTPHVFLFDADRKLRYTGKIDDNWEDASAAEKHYLQDAIDAVLDGRAPSEPETFAIGCTIKWKS